jgi:hypothetical protein
MSATGYSVPGPHVFLGSSIKKPNVHARIDTVVSRKHLELAWEKVKKNRGSAGIDDVTIAPFEVRKAD